MSRHGIAHHITLTPKLSIVTEKKPKHRQVKSSQDIQRSLLMGKSLT